MSKAKQMAYGYMMRHYEHCMSCDAAMFDDEWYLFYFWQQAFDYMD